MSLGMEVGPGPGYIVLDGDPAFASPKKGHSSPHVSANVYCGQMARWIRIPLGTEVGLSPGNIMLDEDTAPPRKQHSSHPLFSPCLL